MGNLFVLRVSKGSTWEATYVFNVLVLILNNKC